MKSGNTSSAIEAVIKKNVSLAEHTTFKIGGTARYFVDVSGIDELLAALNWARTNKVEFFVLSGGSNTVFGEKEYPGLIIHMNIKGYKTISIDDNTVLVEVGAGENWDEVVARTVDEELSGLELLSLIPGLCGSAPVQNIGAYGREFDQIFDSLDAIDTQTNGIVTLDKEACDFKYRSSAFKTSARGRYIITSLRMKLSKTAPPKPGYQDLTTYFDEHDINSPSIQQIRDAVIEIRRAKFPDPTQIPNVGSFFKNPIISRESFDKIAEKYPHINQPRPGWSQPARWFIDDTHVKIGAAWLIEELGLKGFTHKHVKVDDHHALVLENTGGASGEELKELRDIIAQKVEAAFDIKLEVEPDII